MKKQFYILYLSISCLSGLAVHAQYANTRLSNLTSPVAINASLLVDKDNAHNIGSAINTWRNLYLDSAVYLGGLRFLASKTGTGLYNTAVGIYALKSNSTGTNNTAIGYNTLMLNTTTFSNTAIGAQAMSSATASYNTAVGVYALSNSRGINNTAVGYSSMIYNSTGFNNTAEGQDAMHANTEGDDNTAIGNEALATNTVGTSNVALGSFALTSNTEGNVNTAIGTNSLYDNTTGNFNIAVGKDVLSNNINGSSNTGVGFYSIRNNTASQNTAMGSYSLYNTTTGGNNTALGYYAGSNLKTGTGNIFIGYNTNCGSTGAITNSTGIGNGVTVTNNNTFILGNTAVTGWGLGVDPASRAIKVGTTSSNGNGAYLSVGGTWTNTSARSKKEDFQKQDKNTILQKIYQLEVTKWKYKGTANEYHYGPMADDFYKLFSVGDDSSISDMDKTGILFLGMQQLVKLENDKDVAITNLKSEIENLRSEINQLKAMVVTGQPAVSVQSDINNSASLQQNIPNPFSHSTTINYSLPISYSSAKIIITDKKGVVLKETNLSAKGKGSLNVDAATLASGAYQYSLYVDGRLVSSRQMILSKQ